MRDTSIASAGWSSAKAARAFPYPITQPAVHQQVSKLEDDLGLELFERVGKDRMQLTAAGERLYRFVQPFFEGLPGVVRAVSSGDFGGTLIVHAAPLIVRHVMPRWIQRLRKARPELRVHLVEARTTEVERLRDGSADLIVDFLPEWPSDVATMKIASFQGFLVLPSKHRLAGRKRIDVSQLEGDTFVGYSPGSIAHDLQMRALGTHGVAPRDSLSASSAESILAFVQAELGYSLLAWPDPDGPKWPGVHAIPLVSPAVDIPVVAAWRKDTPENPLLDAALETAPKP